MTAVGGTTLIPEIAADLSGGGFSNYVRLFSKIPCVLTYLTGGLEFPRPPWQDAAVNKFLESLPNGTYDGFFNPMGRVWTHHFACSEPNV